MVFTYLNLIKMKRLSLEELRAHKAEQVKDNLEATKGGNTEDCHGFWSKLADTISEAAHYFTH